MKIKKMLELAKKNITNIGYSVMYSSNNESYVRFKDRSGNDYYLIFTLNFISNSIRINKNRLVGGEEIYFEEMKYPEKINEYINNAVKLLLN